MWTRVATLTLLMGLVACGQDDPDPRSAEPEPSDPSPTTVEVMADGPVSPGRYRFTIRNVCEKGDPIGCPDGTVPAPPLDLEVTVPAGWQHWWEFGLLTPDGDDSPTEGPDGAALVMGWTTFHVGLSSNPCLARSHQAPDVEVGPTVDDFVDAVQAQKALDVTEPEDTMVGGFPARFFSLEAPADLSGCEEWRPWDPGFFAQGPSNHWDVWAVDVDGDRVLIVTQRFPDTPAEVVDELAAMVESLEFLP
jgi:hypothetical protein